jgi:hypothetical protein
MAHGGAPRHGASAVAASGRVILMRAWRCHVQGPRGELLSATGDSRARRTLENTAQRSCWSKRMSSGNSTQSQQACASKASLRRCTLWIFLSPRNWVEQTIHRAARPEIHKRQLRLHAFVSSLRAPVWACHSHTSLQGVEGSPCQPNSTELIRIITSHSRPACSFVSCVAPVLLLSFHIDIVSCIKGNTLVTCASHTTYHF